MYYVDSCKLKLTHTITNRRPYELFEPITMNYNVMCASQFNYYQQQFHAPKQ